MRAAVWNGPGAMSVGTAPDAACPEDGVLLRVLACGICGTDVRSFYNGDRRIAPPWVLGHEISGQDRRDRTTRRARDERVRARRRRHARTASRPCGAGRCRMCRSGHENLCLHGELMGFDHPGAYAEHVAIPSIALKNLFRIPDGLSPAHATFADPLSDVICGHKDLAITLDDVVVVIGAGPVGTAHAALARLQGAGQVLLLERTAQRLGLARAILGDERLAYVDTEGEDGTAAVMRATGRLRRRRRDRRLLERRRPGAGDGDGRTARAGDVLRRPAQGHDGDPLPVQRPALPRGSGPRLLRLAPPRPGARARHARRRRRRHPLGGLRKSSPSRTPPAPSSASAPVTR